MSYPLPIIALMNTNIRARKPQNILQPTIGRARCPQRAASVQNAHHDPYPSSVIKTHQPPPGLGVRCPSGSDLCAAFLSAPVILGVCLSIYSVQVRSALFRFVQDKFFSCEKSTTESPL